MARVKSSRYWIVYFHPANLARKPQRLLPLGAILCIVFFVFLDRQRTALELTTVENEIKTLEPGSKEPNPTALEVERLAKEQSELAKETSRLAHEVEELVGILKKQKSEPPPAPPRKEATSNVQAATPYAAGASMQNLDDLNIDFEGWVDVEADIARRDAVKRAMKHAWDGYERHAFGSDELQPISRRGKNLFGGLGATIIDSLDTLYIMDLKDEYERARNWVANQMSFDKHFECSVFETIIRVVGGFLAAFDLSGDPMYVDKCKILVDKLMPAYNTPTGIPYNIINLRSGASKNPAWTSQASTLAEFGTQQLEFVRLSHVTGDDKYARMAENVIKYATDPTANRNRQVPPGGRGLYPLFLNPISGMWTNQKISFGAMGDSFYEYLIKLWVQGGKNPALQRYRQLFDAAMESMMAVLIQRSTPSNLVYVAEYDRAGVVHKMDHLACFVPGMLALGANGPQAKTYLSLAQQLTYTCVQMYSRQPSGLAPEMVNFRHGEDMVSGASHNLLRPETVESLMIMYRKTGDPIFRQWGWEIFQAFEKHCKVADGYAGLRDVRSPNPVKDDTMQSFFLAETLKYLYLLFDSSDVIPMDEWVFNTEAHPMRIWDRNHSYIN